jgi:hypothetical protein
MSTEPDWRAVSSIEGPHLLGAPWRCGIQPAIMLLSFERPALVCVGCSRDIEIASADSPVQAGVTASPRSLKTAQKPHQPPSISGG